VAEAGVAVPADGAQVPVRADAVPVLGLEDGAPVLGLGDAARVRADAGQGVARAPDAARLPDGTWAGSGTAR